VHASRSHGTYRVAGAGTTLANGLITAVGYRILDGQGHLTWAEDTRSVAGQISHRIARTADYTVDPSCAVTEVFADGLTFDGVVAAGGREAFFIRTNPGTVSLPSIKYGETPLVEKSSTVGHGWRRWMQRCGESIWSRPKEKGLKRHLRPVNAEVLLRPPTNSTYSRIVLNVVMALIVIAAVRFFTKR
jgi:hypothetical protein